MGAVKQWQLEHENENLDADSQQPGETDDEYLERMFWEACEKDD